MSLALIQWGSLPEVSAEGPGDRRDWNEEGPGTWSNSCLTRGHGRRHKDQGGGRDGKTDSSSEQQGAARDHSREISRSGFMQSFKGKNKKLELDMKSRGKPADTPRCGQR